MMALTRSSLSLSLSTVLLVLGAWGVSSQCASITEHERLKVKNDFKTPEEVVGYYCARDASGFVWSGLLDVERKAFTLWPSVPQQDSFFIAKSYEIVPGEIDQRSKDHAIVKVKYALAGMGDASGTLMPPAQPEMLVAFDLRKVNGAWKITKPDPTNLAPVVLESKFPYVQSAD